MKNNKKEMTSPKKIDVFDALAIADNMILEKLDNANGDYETIMRVYHERINLYQQVIRKIKDPYDRALIETKKSVILNDYQLYHIQYNLQVDIAKAISQLDDLKAEVSRIRDHEPS